MPTVDLRQRRHVDIRPLDPDTFLDEWAPERVDANGPDAARAATRLGLTPLTLVVDGVALSFRPDQGSLSVTRGAAEGVTLAMDRATFSDLVQDALSTFGATMTGRAHVERGTTDDALAWEPVLRCLLDGRPVHAAGEIEFVATDGSPLDLHRSYTIDDDPAAIAHFLAEAGYLHLRGVFTEAEMAEVAADLDAAMAVAERDDGASWWAATTDGEWYPSRILGFNLKSTALRSLLRSERFSRIGSFTGDPFVQRDPDHGDSAEGLHKKVGVVSGISDVSWHKDCSMGGHSLGCCGLTTGISVTGAGPTNGELGVVAGSHRANIALLGIDGLDLPRVPLPTQTGDVTVHCSCTLHMSRPPVSAERRVVYTGFGLEPQPGDQPPERSESDTRRDRASLNDHVTRRLEQGGDSRRLGNFEL